MKNLTSLSKALMNLRKTIYRFVLPSGVTIFLLIISEGVERPLFSGSKFLDLFARLWLCMIFSLGYIISADLEKYNTWFYGAKTNSQNSAPDPVAMIWNICMSIMLGAFATLISWWAIRTFLPIFNNLAWVLALLNGMLFFVPSLYQNNRVR